MSRIAGADARIDASCCRWGARCWTRRRRAGRRRARGDAHRGARARLRGRQPGPRLPRHAGPAGGDVRRCRGCPGSRQRHAGRLARLPLPTGRPLPGAADRDPGGARDGEDPGAAGDRQGRAEDRRAVGARRGPGGDHGEWGERCAHPAFSGRPAALRVRRRDDVARAGPDRGAGGRAGVAVRDRAGRAGGQRARAVGGAGQLHARRADRRRAWRRPLPGRVVPDRGRLRLGREPRQRAAARRPRRPVGSRAGYAPGRLPRGVGAPYHRHRGSGAA